MPLILAIEPDRRQANQLSTMVRGRLHAELVLGDSADRALAALGERVPDLILTSALLSPKDEAALAERLRSLDGVAAHVQTLTIPVLASPKTRVVSTGRGMLAALRRDRSKHVAPDGCDPAMFAEQCKEYLQRAEIDRAAHVDDHPAPVAVSAAVATPTPLPKDEDRSVEEAFAIEPDEPVAAEPTPVVLAAEPAPVVPHEEPAVLAQAPVTLREEPVAVAPPKPAPVRAVRPVVEEAPSSLIAAVAALEAFESEVVAAQPAVDQVSAAEPAAQAVAAEEPGADPADHQKATAEADLLDLDLSTLLDDVMGGRAPATKPQDEPEIYELDGTTLDVAAIGFEMPQEPAEPAIAIDAREDRSKDSRAFSEVELYTALPRLTTLWPVLDVPLAQFSAPRTPRAGGGTPKDSDDLPDWLDIIEAIRRDAEQAKLTRPDAPQGEPAAKRRRRRRNMPIQDEWGLFDPSQCGFAALIAKLEEITDNDDGPAPRRA
jgi:CheY-like chemotaxis protein